MLTHPASFPGKEKLEYYHQGSILCSLLPQFSDTEAKPWQGQQSFALESQAVGIEECLDGASFSKSSGNCKKFEEAALVSFCFYNSGKASGRKQVQIWLWGFSRTQGLIVKLVGGDSVNSSGWVYSSSSSFHPCSGVQYDCSTFSESE